MLSTGPSLRNGSRKTAASPVRCHLEPVTTVGDPPGDKKYGDGRRHAPPERQQEVCQQAENHKHAPEDLPLHPPIVPRLPIGEVTPVCRAIAPCSGNELQLTPHMTTPPPRADLSTGQRWFSLAEFALGVAIVIGHNVFHRIPNEVPILFVLGWISIRLRDGGWKRVGLGKPDSWRKTILWGVLAGVLIIAAGQLADFVGTKIWRGPPKSSSVIESARVSWKDALLGLGLVWTFAAFGEEMGYRGYLMTRAADVGNRSKLAYLAAVLASSVLFGYGHYYKGPPGILQSTVSGLILGGVYLLSGRNLWGAVLAHGCADTIAIAAAFFGLAD